MKPLSPAARSVVDALRDVAPPTPSDSDRVRALLKARLVATGTTGQPSSIAPVGSTFGKASLVKKLFGVLLLVGSSAVVRHAYVQSLSPSMPAHAVVRAPDQVREHVVASVTPAVDVPRPETPDPIVAASSPNTTTTRAARTSHARPSAATAVIAPTRPAAHSIAQEMEILRTAEDALRSGNASAALDALERHRTLFPNGVLREERLAAHVLAMCALGRVHEAQHEAALFLAASPRSVHADRVRRSCALQHDAQTR